MESTSRRLQQMFDALLGHFGPQHWWPADSALEVMVGAVLTQNTAWENVAKAVSNLKARNWLTLERLHSLTPAELAQVIRPAGYYNIKAKRLQNLMHFIVQRFEGDPAMFLEAEPRGLREELLSIKGIGPETADSILLYACAKPVFVVDAYTYRILRRHGLADEAMTYEELQALFMDHLPRDVPMFNEFHALIVKTGKEYCRKKPLCDQCPLNDWDPGPLLIKEQKML